MTRRCPSDVFGRRRRHSRNRQRTTVWRPMTSSSSLSSSPLSATALPPRVHVAIIHHLLCRRRRWTMCVALPCDNCAQPAPRWYFRRSSLRWSRRRRSASSGMYAWVEGWGSRLKGRDQDRLYDDKGGQVPHGLYGVAVVAGSFVLGMDGLSSMALDVRK
jgi:hypothetical protein